MVVLQEGLCGHQLVLSIQEWISYLQMKAVSNALKAAVTSESELMHKLLANEGSHSAAETSD